MMLKRLLSLLLSIALLSGSALAAEPLAEKDTGMPIPVAAPTDAARPDLALKAALKPEETGAGLVCDLIEQNAGLTGMSADFFARLIWKESRFDPGAVSPVGAQGIAQFMPYTAKERGLADPFDLAEAIRHSALYLRDLKTELGNWGLAAAAYNGGINRVKRWREAGGSLPFETENYVLSITDRPANWFLDEGREIEDSPLDAALSFSEACRQMPTRKATPIVAITQTAPMQPWGVQVAGHPNQAVARSLYRRIQGRFVSVLGGREPIVVRDRTGRGRIYAVRVGAPSRSDADALCAKLRGVGGSCAVFRN